LTPEIEAAIEEIIAVKREHATAHVRCNQLSELFTEACRERNALLEQIYAKKRELGELLDAVSGDAS
jgi:hypothetical protein